MGESLKYTEVNKTCDICGADNFKLVREKPVIANAKVIEDSGKRFQDKDVMCMQCGLVYKNPCLDQLSLDRFYADNDYIQLYDPSLMHGIPKAGILEQTMDAMAFMKWSQEQGIIFDGKRVAVVGAGVGTLSHFIRSVGGIITNIEPGARSREIGSKLYNHQYYDGGLMGYVNNMHITTSTPAPEHDYVIFQNSLEHFFSASEALGYARRIMKNDGILLIEIPDILKIYPMLSIDGWFSSAHNYSYGEKQIMNLLSVAGYRTTSISHDGFKKKMLLSGTKIPEGSLGEVLPQVVDAEEFYRQVMDMSKEVEYARLMEPEWAKELSSSQDVKGYIASLLKGKTATYNSLLFKTVEGLVTQGFFYDALAVLDMFPFDDNGSSDNGVNQATIFLLRAIGYRNIGDMVSFNKLLSKSLAAYPQIQSNNIFREMAMNGIVSQATLAKFHISQAYQMNDIYR